MDQYGKRKNRFTLQLITEDENGFINRRKINAAVVIAAVALLFVLSVAGICGFIYSSITLRDAKKQIIDQIITINNLTDENEALTVENETLSSKVAVLSETVSMKVETEDAISQEIVESAIPKGFPISGSATMQEAQEGDPMLIFTASQGVNVITSGTGTVLSIDVDVDYGTKIVLDHGNGYHSIYRNKGTALVKTGEELGKGYILFSVGEDNLELGYQIMKDEEYIDPMVLIDING